MGSRKFMKTAVFYFVLLFSVQISFGQTTGSGDTLRPGGAGTPTLREIREQDFETRRGAMEALKAMKRERPAEKEKQLTKAEKQRFKAMISPVAEDLATYKEFLKQPKTGIFRLLSYISCESKNVVRVDGDCASVVLGAYAYSFRTEDHSDADYHDLVLNNGFLSSSGLLSQGILTTLGDVPLGDVSLSGKGVEFLSKYEPATTKELAVTQYDQFRKGLTADNFTYSNKVKLEENTTYAVRVIAYRYKDELTARFFGEISPNDKKFQLLEYDKRKDIIAAFRIIRKSEDGGITVLWKQLQEKKSPAIVFQEKEKLSDIK